MSADAEDLKYHFAEDLGVCEIKAASAAAASLAKFVLAPGRYLISYRTIAGAATIWAKLSYAADPDEAEAAAPAAVPHDVALRPDQRLFTVIIRQAPFQRPGEVDATLNRNTLFFRTNAGTADIVVTKISRS